MAALPLVLICGESVNDVGALEHLVRSFLPSGLKVEIRKIQKPPVLSKQAAERKRLKALDYVAAIAKAEQKRRSKVVVVAHRDCDEVEPSHKSNAIELIADMKNIGIANPIAATPAWCIETWWMQFSNEVANVRKCWKKLNYGNTRVGFIEDAKKRLTIDLRASPPSSCPDYHESDSIRIAEEIRKSGVAVEPATLLSHSLSEFRTQVSSTFGEKSSQKR